MDSIDLGESSRECRGYTRFGEQSLTPNYKINFSSNYNRSSGKGGVSKDKGKEEYVLTQMTQEFHNWFFNMNLKSLKCQSTS